MTFLYAVMFDTEKEETTDAKKRNTNIIPTNTVEEIQMAARIAESKRKLEREQQAAKEAMEVEKEKFNREMEKEKAKINAQINKMHEELVIVTDLVVASRQQSRRASALPSRATSPTGGYGTGTLLTGTTSKLKDIARERKLKKRERN